MASIGQTALSLAKKLQILEALKLKKPKEVAFDFKIGYSTVRKIRQQEEEIRKTAMINGNLDRKRKRESPNEEIGDALIAWFNQMRLENVVVNGPLMLEKAKQLSSTLGYDDFDPSHGWLERLKVRHNIKFMKVSGEKAAADHDGAEKWVKNVLPGIIEKYDPNDIFNADESGLFYKATPSGTLAVAGTQPTGGKVPKDRMTVLFLCNSTGSEKKIFAIGKFKKPRCFNRAQPPLSYYSSANAWMTSWIWSDILQKFDRELGDRKIVLLADNAACHKLEIQLKNIKLVFLPPNTTSLIQPLDQGIIRAAKAHYRTQVMRKILHAIESGISMNDYIKSIDFLKALHMLKRAWFLVSPTTISNCFRKAGIQRKAESESLEKNNESVDIDTVAEIFSQPEFVDFIGSEEFEAFVDCDNDADCFGSLTDNEICDLVKRNRQTCINIATEADDDEPIDEESPVRMSHKDALMHLAAVRKYLEENFTDYNAYYEIEDMIEKNVLKNCKQTKITDFFK